MASNISSRNVSLHSKHFMPCRESFDGSSSRGIAGRMGELAGAEITALAMLATVFAAALKALPAIVKMGADIVVVEETLELEIGTII